MIYIIEFEKNGGICFMSSQYFSKHDHFFTNNWLL